MSRPAKNKATPKTNAAVTTVNGKTPAVTGEVSLIPTDLGFTLDTITPADIGAAAYPSGGSDGWSLVKSGTSTAWSNVSGTAAGLTADALATNGAASVGVWGAQRKPMKVPTLTSTVTTFQSGHGWTGGTDDTSIFRLGSQSLRCDPAVHASTITYVTSPTLGSTIDMVANSIELMIYMPATVATGTTYGLSTMWFEVSSNGGTNWVSVTATQSNPVFGRRDQWVTVRLNKSSFGTGTITWTAINKIRIGSRTNTALGAAVPFYVQRVGVYTNPSVKGTISLVMDGYTESLPYLDSLIARNLRATINMRPGNSVAGTNSALSAAQLQQLSDGFGFGSLVTQWGETEVNTTDYILTNPAEFEAGILKCLHWYKNNGLERPRCWWAGMGSTGGIGSTHAPAMQAIARTYFESAILSSTNADYQPVNAYPLSDPYAMSGLFLFGGGAGMVSNYQKYIDAIAETKGHGNIWVIKLGATSNSTIISGTEYATMLDYIIAKGSAVEVITTNELVETRV